MVRWTRLVLSGNGGPGGPGGQAHKIIISDADSARKIHYLDGSTKDRKQF